MAGGETSLNRPSTSPRMLAVRSTKPLSPKAVTGARGVMIESADDVGPALCEALAADLPTVIQAPMENAPTPTPGHWDINNVYRRGV